MFITGFNKPLVVNKFTSENNHSFKVRLVLKILILSNLEKTKLNNL